MRRATNYGNCVTVKANPLGLGFSVPFLFRIGHPPLLIAWSDITTHRVRRRRFFPSLIELRFRLEPSIPVRVNNKAVRYRHLKRWEVLFLLKGGLQLLLGVSAGGGDQIAEIKEVDAY